MGLELVDSAQGRALANCSSYTHSYGLGILMRRLHIRVPTHTYLGLIHGIGIRNEAKINQDLWLADDSLDERWSISSTWG